MSALHVKKLAMAALLVGGGAWAQADGGVTPAAEAGPAAAATAAAPAAAATPAAAAPAPVAPKKVSATLLDEALNEYFTGHP